METETEDASPLGRLRAASGLAGHLADVGDAALGYFVDQARHAGHSWAQIGDALGVSKQAAQQRQTVRQKSSVEELGFERLTLRARTALNDAELIARSWGHGYVGTEHLLLSLYRDPHGLAAVVLVESGLNEEQAAEAVAELVERGTGAPAGTLPFTPKAAGVLDAARTAAVDLGHGYLGTEHLLIGLDRIDGVARQVLARAGLTPELIDQRVVAKLAPHEQRGAQTTGDTSPRAEQDVE